LHETPVPARLVEYEVIERAFENGLMTPYIPTDNLEHKVAIVGSGPAGLSAAYYLRRAGALVTVYERDKKPGGFLRYGIPDFKLEKSVIDRRIKLMEEEGVIFENNVEVGVDMSFRLLLDRFDALILALGARSKRDLNVPGRQLHGIHFATDYLSTQNRVNSHELYSLPKEYNAKGKKVIVIGGGDTGSDCVGTSLRQGAISVTQFEILPKPPIFRAENNPWPQWPLTLRTSSSHEEGCERRWNIETLEFLPNPTHNSLLGSLRIREVNWVPQEDGRSKPVPKENSETIVEADMVLLAMGFTGPEATTLYDGHKKPDQYGHLEGRVYVCGDAANGPSLVVRAMASGLVTAKTLLDDFKPIKLAL
jgi:glutamate synthase (NADPH/NADH) small chain